MSEMTDEQREAAIEAETDKVSAAFNAIAALRYPELGEDTPYVQAWVASAEWTNIDLERRGAYRYDVFSPLGQTHAATIGVTRLLKKRVNGA